MEVYQFTKGAIIQDVFTKTVYEVIENDKRGLGLLLNMTTGKKEPWNAYNNNRFIYAPKQLMMF